MSTGDKYKVSMSTLDMLRPEKLGEVKLIKFDVEGHESSAKGKSNDTSLNQLYEENALHSEDRESSLETLQSYGYEFSIYLKTSWKMLLN